MQIFSKADSAQLMISNEREWFNWELTTTSHSDCPPPPPQSGTGYLIAFVQWCSFKSIAFCKRSRYIFIELSFV
jgi:hypothetical protein